MLQDTVNVLNKLKDEVGEVEFVSALIKMYYPELTIGETHQRYLNNRGNITIFNDTLSGKEVK